MRFSVILRVRTRLFGLAGFLVCWLAHAGIVQAAPAAPELEGVVYSETAAELFWNRVPSEPQVVSYEVFADDLLVTTTDGTSYFSDSLSPDITYNMTVVAVDAEGEKSERSNRVVINTGGNSSGGAPSTPQGVTSVVYSATAAEVFWDRSTDDVAVSFYEVYKDNELIQSLDALSFFDDTLTEGVTYSYYVVAIDNAGNRSAASAPTTLTAGVFDVNPPMTELMPPETISAFAYSADTIEIIWSRSVSTDNSGIYYQLFRDDVFVSEMDALSYLDTGLQADTVYEYRVATVNGNGDSSALTEPVAIQTLGGPAEFDITNETAFREAFQKAWLGPCGQFDDESGSFQYTSLFSDTEYVFDFYLYESLDCSGIPEGFLFPLVVDSYSLGGVVALTDGTLAWEFDGRVVQQGVGPEGDAYSEEVGSEYFDILTLINGVPTFGATYATTPEERPTEALPYEVNTIREPRGKPDFSESDLIGGEWASYCRRLSQGGTRQFRSVFTEGAELVIEEYWPTDDCSGESYGIVESNLARSYGEVYQSVYGDYLLATDWERVDSTVTKFDESAGFVEPSVRPTGPDTYEYDALALEEGGVLMTAYCLIANAEVCEKVESARADMIDFNWPERYSRSDIAARSNHLNFVNGGEIRR